MPLLGKIGALPCVLGGLSMGGYVALAYWKKYAADLRGPFAAGYSGAGGQRGGEEGRETMIELAKARGAVGVADQMMPKMMAGPRLGRKPKPSCGRLSRPAHR